MSRTFLLDPKAATEVHAEYCRVLDELERDRSPETQYLTRTSPSKEHVRSLIEESFWASLERVEGRHHRFCIAVCPKSSVDEPFLFEKPVPFDSKHLAKLSPALQAERMVIGVWPAPAMVNLEIWGFWPEQTSDSAWVRPPNAPPRLLLKAVDAGKILFDFGSDSTYLRTLFTGTQKEDIELSADPLFNALYSPQGSQRDDKLDCIWEFRDIAIHMRTHGHGGTLLIVRSDNKNWRESIDFGANKIERYRRPKRSPVTEAIAQLTAIDGATIVTYDLTVLGFGGKIHPRTDPINAEAQQPELEEVLESTPFKQHTSIPRRVSDLNWGTRHLSAARFVLDQKNGSMAIVASQDGELSIFHWVIENQKGMVGITRQAEFALL